VLDDEVDGHVALHDLSERDGETYGDDRQERYVFNASRHRLREYLDAYHVGHYQHQHPHQADTGDVEQELRPDGDVPVQHGYDAPLRSGISRIARGS
jgi:hypothetical protein